MFPLERSHHSVGCGVWIFGLLIVSAQQLLPYDECVPNDLKLSAGLYDNLECVVGGLVVLVCLALP